jgi:translation initiation factor 4G
MLGEKTSSTGVIKRGLRVNKEGGPVGMATTVKEEGGKNAAKNKARKERQRRAKEAAEMKAKQDEEEEERKKQEEAALKAAKGADPTLMNEVELGKKIKKLKKQLRSIEALKIKDKSTLNEAQQSKLLTESSLLSEVSKLEEILK